MRTFTVTLALLLTLSLVFITNANQRHSNDALREQLLDYLVQARREQLFENQRKKLENQIQRFQEKFAANIDESSESEEYEKTINRRKAVGLGDNPYK